MKKLFTIDDFIVAFISAMAYGLSFEIPKILGVEIWQALIFCLVIGGTVDTVTKKIVFSEAVQKSTTNKALIFLALFVIVITGDYVAFSLTGLSAEDYLLENYISLILPSILGFVFSMAVRWYQIKKIRARYGDGSQGFLYDELATPENIAEFNQQNQPIKGEYDTELAVKTKTGIFVGYKEKKAIAFFGIPYAKSPVGERRWKAPAPLPESDAVFEAKYFGASAIQVDHEGSILKHHRQSEDCLTLNIAISKNNNVKKKPVFVLFHHGDFSFGGSADPLMYSEKFTRADLEFVGVSFNYRLGIFGFIDFSEIPGGENYPDALNLGLLDQIAALQWIKENISAFGGDPENITVIGFESGATSISLLAACERAKGLFKKAFMFFGTPDAAHDSPQPARNLAAQLLKETSTKTMAELQQLPTEKLKAAAQKLWLNIASPTRDGKLIPEDVITAYKMGAADGIEFIIGIPSNEHQIYKSFMGQQNYENYISKEIDEILSYPDAQLNQALKNYINNLTTQNISELDAKSKFFEQWNALSAYLCAMQLAAGGNKVHLMYWDVKPLIENLGSGTVDVVSTLFENRATLQLYGNVLDPTISEILQTFLQKFIKGDELQIYNNEIKGVEAMEWKKFPDALVVSNKEFRCEPIEDKLKEFGGLLELMKKIFAAPARE